MARGDPGPVAYYTEVVIAVVPEEIAGDQNVGLGQKALGNSNSIKQVPG